MTEFRKRTSRKSRNKAVPFISEVDLARLGDGQIAYIRSMTSDEARALFPSIEGLPSAGSLFALNAADGTPLMLTDSRQAALGHALEDELEVASLH